MAPTTPKSTAICLILASWGDEPSLRLQQDNRPAGANGSTTKTGFKICIEKIKSINDCLYLTATMMDQGICQPLTKELTQLDHFRPRFGFLWAGTLKQINHLNRARG